MYPKLLLQLHTYMYYNAYCSIIFSCFVNCYRVTNDTACAKTYQAVLTVIGFTANHSGIYTVTLENRGGMITEQFERRLEG